YANAHIAFGRLYNTLGFDPIADDFENNDLTALTERVRSHLKTAEKGAFEMSSNLFGRAPSVNVHLAGITDPVQNVRMKALVTELLARNDITTTDSTDATPLTLAYHAVGNNGLDKATWTVGMTDEAGQPQQARFATTIPSNSRTSVYESS